jgi:hypothetical protein
MIDRLAELIVNDNVVFFVGGDFPTGGDSTSMWRQLVEKLAEEIDYIGPDRSLAAVAQEYEDQNRRGELIITLKESLRELGEETAAGQELVLQRKIIEVLAPYTKLVTTRFDEAMELALQEARKRFVPVIRNEEVSALDESRIALIKVAGDIRQEDTLVITETDFEGYFDKRRSVGDVVRAYFATKALVFLGYDLQDSSFRRFFRQISSQGRRTEYARPAYIIVQQEPPAAAVKHWQRQFVNVEVHKRIDHFLDNLGRAVKQLVPDGATAPPQTENPLSSLARPPLPAHPYKSLDSFEGRDAAIFHGRRYASRALANRVLGERLTVLYGESGSGKTSLIQAGVRPLLALEESLLITLPVAPGIHLRDALGQAIVAIAKEAKLAIVNDQPIAQLQAWRQLLGSPIVIALDQFEQTFEALGQEERQAAAGTLRDWLADELAGLHLLIVIREDYLGRLQNLEERVPSLLDNLFRLERMGDEQARAAIVEPAASFGWRWEPALVERLLADLREERGVDPPKLQIVCDRIYGYSAAVDKEDPEITSADYEALGGAAAILEQYIDEVVNAFAPEQATLAKRLLGALSGGGIKIRLERNDLLRSAETDLARAQPVLDSLTDQRIIRRIQDPNDSALAAYELTHDTLTYNIVQWLGDDFWNSQRARQIVRDAVPRWDDSRRLLSLTDLRLIKGQRGRVQFKTDELPVIYASAIAYNDESDIWSEDMAGEAIRQVLSDLSSSEEAAVRQQSLRHLVAFADEEVSRVLSTAATGDQVESVRKTAARGIARSENEAAFDFILQNLQQTRSSETASHQELETLVLIRDEWPAVQSQLPARLRGPVRRRVWARRWRRRRDNVFQATRRGALAGFWSIGLGLGTFIGFTLVTSNATLDELLSLLAFSFLPVVQQLLLPTIGYILFAGFFGGLALAGGALVRATLVNLADKDNGWLVWLATVLVTATLVGISLLFMNFVRVAGPPDIGSTLATGALIGGAVSAVATLQLPWSWIARMIITVLASIAVHFLVSGLGALFGAGAGWLIWMGIVTGAGFFLAFNERQSDSTPAPDQGGVT